MSTISDKSVFSIFLQAPDSALAAWPHLFSLADSFAIHIVHIYTARVSSSLRRWEENILLDNGHPDRFTMCPPPSTFCIAVPCASSNYPVLPSTDSMTCPAKQGRFHLSDRCMQTRLHQTSLAHEHQRTIYPLLVGMIVLAGQLWRQLEAVTARSSRVVLS